MKRSFFCLITAFALCFSHSGHAQGNPEAAKRAREGAEAAKNQDWDAAIEAFGKAAALDKKFAQNLAAAYQQRGFNNANDRRFPEAIADFSEALKIDPREPGIFERRAAVEMKINDWDKALADYTEAIKLKPNEVRFYLYRGYIFEAKGDLKNSMADTEKALKIDKRNAEAEARKARLETRMKQQAGAPPNAPPPPPAGSPPLPPPKSPK